MQQKDGENKAIHVILKATDHADGCIGNIQILTTKQWQPKICLLHKQLQKRDIERFYYEPCSFDFAKKEYCAQQIRLDFIIDT